MIRDLMIAFMREQIPAEQHLNRNSRYGGYFYVPLEFPPETVIGKGMKKRINKFNRSTEGKYNMLTLEELNDEQLFNAYTAFMRCYGRQM